MVLQSFLTDMLVYLEFGSRQTTLISSLKIVFYFKLVPTKDGLLFVHCSDSSYMARVYSL